MPLAFYAWRYRRAGGRCKGDITPAYSILPRDRISFIRRIMPDVRLVFIMRDPVERSWSEAMHNLLRKSGKRRLEDVPPEAIVAVLNSSAVRQRSDYLMILDNWLSVFPREQLYITFFERLRHEPQTLLMDILQHIEASTEIDWSAVPLTRRFNVNPSTVIPAPFRTMLEERYAPMIEELARRFGLPVEAWR